MAARSRTERDKTELRDNVMYLKKGKEKITSGDGNQTENLNSSARITAEADTRSDTGKIWSAIRFWEEPTT